MMSVFVARSNEVSGYINTHKIELMEPTYCRVSVNRTVISLLAVSSLVAPSQSVADIIAYSTLGEESGGGIRASVGGTGGQIVNHFTPNKAGIISRFTWLGRKSRGPIIPAEEHTLNFGIAIFKDNDGLPSLTPTYTAADGLSVTPIENSLFRFPAFRYDVEVLPVFEIVAGEQLWLSIFETTDEDSKFGWSQVGDVFGNATQSFYRGFGSADWTTTDFLRTKNFHIEIAVVPEPMTTISVVVGLAACLAWPFRVNRR